VGLIFANYNMYLVPFVIVTIVVVTALPRIVPWLFDKVGKRASEPEIKFLFLVLFGLGGLASLGKSEAALPAYLVGMGLAPFFSRDSRSWRCAWARSASQCSHHSASSKPVR